MTDRAALIELEHRREARNHGYHLECEPRPGVPRACCTIPNCPFSAAGTDRYCRPCARRMRVCRHCGESLE